MAIDGSKEVDCVIKTEKKIKDENIIDEGNFPKIYKCTEPNCEKAYSWKESMQMHHRRTHNPKNELFCEECGKMYIHKSTLKLHKESHNPWRMCSTCGITVDSKLKYDRHIQKCENSYKFTCDICKKGFTSTQRLVNHIRVHTKEKPFPCDRCDVKFSRSDKLLAHKRRHDGIKSFKCDQCSWSGYDSSDLCHHKKKHS